VRAPKLGITQEAHAALQERLVSSGLSNPHASLLWASENGHEPKWHVAFYEKSGVYWFQRCRINNVPFCFVQPAHKKRLNGAVLDWQADRFVVHEKAAA
jgi:hypothetical protein